MSVSKETLRRMVQEFGGLELSDTELDAVLPHVQGYVDLADRFRQLDLSKVLAGRLLRADEGGNANAR